MATVRVFAGALPIGVQVVGPRWRDDLCLRAASALEACGAAAARPPVRSAAVPCAVAPDAEGTAIGALEGA